MYEKMKMSSFYFEEKDILHQFRHVVAFYYGADFLYPESKVKSKNEDIFIFS
jgi:hypothetical protein